MGEQHLHHYRSIRHEALGRRGIIRIPNCRQMILFTSIDHLEGHRKQDGLQDVHIQLDYRGRSYFQLCPKSDVVARYHGTSSSTLS
jgi:hypothetical protein